MTAACTICFKAIAQCWTGSRCRISWLHIGSWGSSRNVAQLWLVSRGSEIRLVRLRDCGVSAREPFDVFGANRFRPAAAATPIGHGRGPRRRKGACILDRELELQVLAPVVWLRLGAPILFCVPLPPVLCGFVFNEPISFDHVQSLRVRRAIPVHGGEGSDLDPHRIYDQRIAFVT